MLHPRNKKKNNGKRGLDDINLKDYCTIRIYFKTVYIARLEHAVLIFGLLRYLNINFGVLH